MPYPRTWVDDVFVAALNRYVGVCRSPQHDAWRTAAYRTDPVRSTTAAAVHLGPPLVLIVLGVLFATAIAARILGWTPW